MTHPPYAPSPASILRLLQPLSTPKILGQLRAQSGHGRLQQGTLTWQGSHLRDQTEPRSDSLLIGDKAVLWL